MAVPTQITDLSTTAASNSPQGGESIGTNLDDYLRAAFAFIKQINDLTGTPRVLGLTGNANATTPLTKYDLSATYVVLRNSSGGVVARNNTGTLTCDLGLAGSIANGRDQAAAFSASSWIHLYFIWNGTTLSTLASATAPSSFNGSSLPTGYTHWAYAGSLYFNASSNIVKVRFRNANAYYEAKQNALSAGGATTETAVSLTSLIPPSASEVLINAYGYAQSNAGGGASSQMLVRHISGSDYGVAPVQLNGASQLAYGHMPLTLPNNSQTIYYLFGNEGAPANINARSMNIDVIGYTMPNGG